MIYNQTKKIIFTLLLCIMSLGFNYLIPIADAKLDANQRVTSNQVVVKKQTTSAKKSKATKTPRQTFSFGTTKTRTPSKFVANQLIDEETDRALEIGLERLKKTVESTHEVLLSEKGILNNQRIES